MSVDPRLVPSSLHTLLAALEECGTDAVSTSRPTLGGSSRRGAVLILLGGDPLDVVITERAATLRSHPGQLSFPGGSIDEGESVVGAALREAREEVGLNPDQVLVLGEMPAAHVAASRFDVSSVVGSWDGLDELAPVDAAEVASVHRLRLDDLADPANRVTARVTPAIASPAFVAGELFVWGFTAHLLDVLLRLGGWHREWDTEREVPVPERFFRDRHQRLR